MLSTGNENNEIQSTNEVILRVPSNMACQQQQQQQHHEQQMRLSWQPKDWMNTKLMAHYMKYALGSYGWPFFMYANLCTGLCKLCSKCQ